MFGGLASLEDLVLLKICPNVSRMLTLAGTGVARNRRRTEPAPHGTGTARKLPFIF